MIKLPDFKEGQEYRILRETASAYAARELAPQAEQIDLNPDLWRVREAIARAGDMGMLAAFIPEEHGGGGLDGYAFCVALEEIAAEEAGIAAALLAHNAALLPAALGEPEALITGVEPDAYPACLAFPGEVSYSGGKVEGRVPFAFNARDCSLITLLPTGSGGTQALTVRGDAQGVEIRAEEYQMGLKAARAGSLRLDGAEPSNVISGGDLAGEVERVLFVGLAAVATGISRKALQKAYAYACERYQAGRMIIEHQQMRIFLAEMLVAVEQGRAQVKKACEDGGLASAMAAWLRATEAACMSATNGVQVHGGYGYMRDYGMERLMRDAKYCQMYPSTSQEVLLRLLEMSERD
jgi:alkylation response protein AidB-like acyl-CoA dehydrogenase